MKPYIIPFEKLKNKDVELVGGKNASIGEMISGLAALGVSVPGGFATTAHAYRDFLAQGGLDERIRAMLATLDVDDVERLSGSGRGNSRLDACHAISRQAARLKHWTPGARCKAASDSAEFAVAVRSSATAEDLPEASFAGQQETFLNVRGEEQVLKAMHEVYASLFNDRAISYRVHNKFDHSAVALSVGMQHMVRSDLGAAGVMFTLDTESGFRDVVFITAAYGLGETVVQGAVNPDEFYVYKPALRAGRALDPAQESRRQGDQDGLCRCGRQGTRAHRRGRACRPAIASRWTRPTSRILRSRRSSSRNITARRWTSSGARTAQPARSTSCKRARKPCKAAPGARYCATR